MTTSSDELNLLRLMSLMSPTLPIGGFTYSQGIEKAVEECWITDVNTAYEWLNDQLSSGLAYTDLPILHKFYNAYKENNRSDVLHWCQVLLAYRETSELRQEEINKGRALTKVLASLDKPIAKEWESLICTNHLSGFALISNHWGISIKDLLLSYSWSWLENQVSAVVKIIPLGQTQGQQLLHKLIALVPEIVNQSMALDEQDIGLSQPALAIMSSLHETQYTRIFRS